MGKPDIVSGFLRDGNALSGKDAIGRFRLKSQGRPVRGPRRARYIKAEKSSHNKVRKRLGAKRQRKT
jgi:hypothetical protein